MWSDSHVGIVRASNGSYRSVSLRGCRLDGFYMTSSRLAGDLDLRKARMTDPLTTEQEQERVSL
jgi:hypothetical protein